MTPRPRFRRPATAAAAAQAGFTLIEILTVIAIIAVLAAIIFPVFGSVRENARRSACMSNMREIYQHVRGYELDNRQYPEFLFMPAVNEDGNALKDPTDPDSGPIEPASAVSMQVAAGLRKGQAPDLRSRSLYPEYARSLDLFHCPNNVQPGGNIVGASGAEAVVSVRRREGNTSLTPGAVAPKTRLFYKYDSYDANQRIDPATLKPVAATSTNPSAFVARYRTLWTDIKNVSSKENGGDPEGAYERGYQNQLLWQRPSDTSVITACSYHANQEAMIMLFLNGTAKVYPISKMNTLQRDANRDAKINGDKTTDPTTDFDLYKFGPTD